MAGFGKLQKAGKQEQKKAGRPNRSRLYLGDNVPQLIRLLAKEQKADISGMATYLILQGIKATAGNDEVKQFLTDSDNFAFAFGWDYEQMEKEASELLVQLTG